MTVHVGSNMCRRIVIGCLVVYTPIVYRLVDICFIDIHVQNDMHILLHLTEMRI